MHSRRKNHLRQFFLPRSIQNGQYTHLNSEHNFLSPYGSKAQPQCIAKPIEATNAQFRKMKKLVFVRQDCLCDGFCQFHPVVAICQHHDAVSCAGRCDDEGPVARVVAPMPEIEIALGAFESPAQAPTDIQAWISRDR